MSHRDDRPVLVWLKHSLLLYGMGALQIFCTIWDGNCNRYVMKYKKRQYNSYDHRVSYIAVKVWIVGIDTYTHTHTLNTYAMVCVIRVNITKLYICAT